MSAVRISAVLAVLGLAWLPSAEASNAKAQVVVEIDRIEQQIQKTRWNLNTQDAKKALQRELRLLNRLYDRIIAYEGDLNAFPCAGAVMDPSGGPPRSSESTDAAGLLAQRDLQAGRTYDSLFGQPGTRFGFLAAITDVEVRILAQIVSIDDRLETEDWHFNNQDEKRSLLDLKASLQQTLRRVRNSRC